MAWNLSTGAAKALLSFQPSAGTYKVATTLGFGDGTGTGGRDTITDSGNGLASFAAGDFILVLGGNNHNIVVKALSVAAGTIEVAAGSFTTQAAGSAYAIAEISSGSFAQVFKNSVLVGRTGVRPAAGADATESGTELIVLTLNAGAFTPGVSTNGVNAGAFSGATLQRAIDPATGVAEIIRGIGLATDTIGHVRWYANDKTTGSSTSAIRMDGVAATSGADVNLSTGTSIVTGVYSEVTSLNLTMAGV